MATTPNVPTLQTVLDRLPMATGLTAKTLADAVSAIHVFCRELGRQPGEVLVGQVETLGRGLNAAVMGVTRGRLNNIRSLVRTAVAATVAERARPRLDFRLAPIWESLALLLKGKQDEQDRNEKKVYGEYLVLRRLFRILQLQGVEPGALTAADFDRVRGYLHETGASRPDAMYRKMVLVWNHLQSLLRPYRT